MNIIKNIIIVISALIILIVLRTLLLFFTDNTSEFDLYFAWFFSILILFIILPKNYNFWK